MVSEELLNMGFPEFKVKAALIKANTSPDAAMNWLFENGEQPDEFFVSILSSEVKVEKEERTSEHTELLNPLLGKVRVPTANDRVHKDECAFSFANQMCDGGINVSLQSFVGVGSEYLEEYSSRTGDNVFLNIRKRKRFSVEDSPEKNPVTVEKATSVYEASSMLTAGPEYDEDLSLVVLKAGMQEHTTLPINQATDLPTKIRQAIDKVVKSSDKIAFDSLDNFEDKRLISKHADTIPLLRCERQLSHLPAMWKCDVTGDGIDKSSLWLNLSDGFIGG